MLYGSIPDIPSVRASFVYSKDILSFYICSQHSEQASQRLLPSWKCFRMWKPLRGLEMSPFSYSCWVSRLFSTPPSPALYGQNPWLILSSGMWRDVCLSPRQLMIRLSSLPSASSLQRTPLGSCGKLNCGENKSNWTYHEWWVERRMCQPLCLRWGRDENCWGWHRTVGGSRLPWVT